MIPCYDHSYVAEKVNRSHPYRCEGNIPGSVMTNCGDLCVGQAEGFSEAVQVICHNSPANMGRKNRGTDPI